jgi:hypothetical protein
MPSCSSAAKAPIVAEARRDRERMRRFMVTSSCETEGLAAVGGCVKGCGRRVVVNSQNGARENVRLHTAVIFRRIGQSEGWAIGG